MRRLKLIQGLSYAVRGFSCALGVPFEVEDDLAKRLLFTGRFEELPCVPDNDDVEDEAENTLQFSERELSADGIAKMKKAELEALAAEKQIDISDCSNNNERADKICGVLGLASTVQMGLED